MKKFFRLFHPTVIIAVLMLIGGATFAQEEITAVEDSAFGDHTRRPRVVFQHDAHNEAAAFEYAACHHIYEDGQLLEDEAPEDRECSKCHADTDDPQHLDLVTAYHNRCKGCHEEEKKGPVICSECHVK